MCTIIEIFNAEEHNNLIQFIDNPTEIFHFINYVFSNPNEKNINNLNTLYNTFNKYDPKALDKIKNKDNKTLIEMYTEYICDNKDDLLQKHINNYINSRSFTNNLFNLFKTTTNQPLNKIPNIIEIVNRLESLEKTVNELKVRISNENFLSEGTSS